MILQITGESKVTYCKDPLDPDALYKRYAPDKWEVWYGYAAHFLGKEECEVCERAYEAYIQAHGNMGGL